MSLPNPSEVFVRLIDHLEHAASDARQLAFLRQQNEWLVVDEKLLQMRRYIIMIAEAKEKQGIIIQ